MASAQTETSKKFNLFKSKVEFGDCVRLYVDVDVRFAGVFLWALHFLYLFLFFVRSLVLVYQIHAISHHNLFQSHRISCIQHSVLFVIFFRHEAFLTVISALFHIQSYLWRCAINWHAKNEENWIFFLDVQMKLRKNGNQNQNQNQNHSEAEDNRNVSALIHFHPNICILINSSSKSFAENQMTYYIQHCEHISFSLAPHSIWAFFSFLRIEISPIVIRMKLHLTWHDSFTVPTSDIAWRME